MQEVNYHLLLAVLPLMTAFENLLDNRLNFIFKVTKAMKQEACTSFHFAL